MIQGRIVNTMDIQTVRDSAGLLPTKVHHPNGRPVKYNLGSRLDWDVDWNRGGYRAVHRDKSGFEVVTNRFTTLEKLDKAVEIFEDHKVGRPI